MDDALPVNRVTAEHYLTMCSCMDKDPLDNAMFILVEKDTGRIYTKVTEHGDGMVVFPDPLQLALFAAIDMPGLNMSTTNWYPCPLRQAVIETDKELQEVLVTIEGNFKLKEMKDIDSGTMYITEDISDQVEMSHPQQPPLNVMGLFGDLTEGQA